MRELRRLHHKEHNAHVLELTAQEREELAALIAGLPPLDVRCVDEQTLTRLELLGHRVPVRIAEALIRFRKHGNREGALLLRNLPTDSALPATPADGRWSAAKTTTVSEYNLLLLLQLLGEPIAYEDEKEGVLVQNICPVAGCEERQENTGSGYLEFHTEDGFHPYKPDFVGLYCLRPDHDGMAKTITASIRKAVELIPETAVFLLRKPHYRITLSSSFRHGKYMEGTSLAYSRTIPVLSGSWLDPDMCIDFYLMQGINPRAQWALDVLKEALESCVSEYILCPGDMLVVDNRKAAHARTAFRPRYDGADRWLQRLLITRDIRRSASSRRREGHVCSPLFTLQAQR